MSAPATRLEHDLLGDKAVPRCLLRVQTARALENFHISGGTALYPNVIKPSPCQAGRRAANYDCKQFDEKILRGIEGACQRL